ncbi:MAG: hypothetical protein AYL28_000200 [Candidatus Bathyarchaeota archaeon B23]|nr:MAG: hypothetical protein AYL28_000200 [Candidatus Bathyarchaeota archaeon B23]
MNALRRILLHELAVSKHSLWELLGRCQFLLRDLLEELNSLVEEGLVAADEGGLWLTERGRALVDEAYLRYRPRLCEACGGRRIILDDAFQELLQEFKEATRRRPLPQPGYFQGYMREHDVVARVALMHYYGDLWGREVILIGDDDLLSVALSMTGLPKRVVVVDIDERLGLLLSEIAGERGLDIEFRRYDVAEPLPDDLIGAFDVFSTEPLETWLGLRAFILRGVGCLREGGVGYFGLTRAEASLEKWRRVEALVTRMNFAVTDVIAGFSYYPTKFEEVDYEAFVRRLRFPVGENPGVDWYRSTLFRIEAVGRPRLVVDPGKRLRLTYIDEEEDITHPALYEG